MTTAPRPRFRIPTGMRLVNLLCGGWSWLAFAPIYLSIVLLVVFSFNKSELVSVWERFSFEWYGKLWENTTLIDAKEQPHTTALFPDAMRYFWKDWPAPVKAGASKNGMLNDIPNAKTCTIARGGKVAEFIADSKKTNGRAAVPDERMFVVMDSEAKIVALDAGAKAATIAEGVRGDEITVLNNGNICVTEPAPGSKPGGEKEVGDVALKCANCIVASPDQTLLYVDDARSHWVYDFPIQPDGKFMHKQRYFWLHEPDIADDSGTDGMEVDGAGRLYVAARRGMQVCDQASNVAFGGKELVTLFVTAGDKVFKRQGEGEGRTGLCRRDQTESAGPVRFARFPKKF